MDKINLQKFYDLGAALKPLVQLNPEKVPGSDPVPRLIVALLAQVAVKNLLSEYSELHYCRAAGEKLQDYVERWYASWREEHAGKQENVHYDITIGAVINQAGKFEHLLLEELQAESVFRVTQTGIYNTLALMERAELDYPQSARAKLRPEVVTEIRECGRCLAFGVATAAGFHALRALELVMLDYWIEVCAPSPKPVRIDNWGQCISQLRDKSDPALPKPPFLDIAKAVALLQQLKDDDRNLVMHSEKVLDADDALTLFKLCQTATIAMADRLVVAEEAEA